jgi:hypothetical protein
MAGDASDRFVSAKDWSTKKLLRDYTHASKTFRDGNYRLAPKQKFTFFVVFNYSPMAANFGLVDTADDIKREVSMMVKSVDLPSYTFDTQLMNQYNRWRAVQTKINYNPVQIRFHDDMADISKRLWYSYYTWYYGDSTNGPEEKYTKKADTYTDMDNKMRFGMARPMDEKFFTSIQLYSIYGAKKFSEYTLVNPIITQFNHDSHDHSQSDILENTMQIQYETVKYAEGTMEGGQPNPLTGDGPRGFGELHYDHDISPNDIANNKRWEKMVNDNWREYKQDLARQYKADFDKLVAKEEKKIYYEERATAREQAIQNTAIKKSDSKHSFPGSTRPNPHTDSGVSVKRDMEMEKRNVKHMGSPNPHVDDEGVKRDMEMEKEYIKNNF